MKRRNFLKKLGIGVSAIATGTVILKESVEALKPSSGIVLGEGWIPQITKHAYLVGTDNFEQGNEHYVGLWYKHAEESALIESMKKAQEMNQLF